MVGIDNRGGMMADRNDWNRQTIEAFRKNGGKVGGMWEGRPLLVLTTTGAKSGRRHTTPTMLPRPSSPVRSETGYTPGKQSCTLNSASTRGRRRARFQ